MRALTGPAGAMGMTGKGIPLGGKAGNVLIKLSDKDYDTAWADIRNLFPASGRLTAADLLVENDDPAPIRPSGRSRTFGRPGPG